jgi:hypothetical protein
LAIFKLFFRLPQKYHKALDSGSGGFIQPPLVVYGTQARGEEGFPATPLTVATWWEQESLPPTVPLSWKGAKGLFPLLELYYLGGNAQTGISRGLRPVKDIETADMYIDISS